MDPKVTEKTTPKKTMQNILYEQVQGKFAHSTFNSDSPFRLMPNFCTPPSRFTKIFNPFEPSLSERLHLPVFSPSVFTPSDVSSNSKTEEKFRWTIEEISSLKPADIDVNSTDQFEATEGESVLDSQAQERINTFFSEKIIVPSPMIPSVNVAPLISADISPRGKSFKDVTAQTMLSLPPILPKHIEEALKPYFNCEPDQKQPVDTALYNKLFDVNHDTPDSVQSSPALSVALSPIQFSPFHCKNFSLRKSDNMSCSSPLRECDISPIRRNSLSVDVSRERRPATRLNFATHMSVDSIVLVPDGSFLAADKSAVMFESCQPLSPQEVLSESVVNWDMEYKHIESADSSCNEMDVSTSNTPRSRLFLSQRKKLSDSFLLEDENKENEERVPQHHAVGHVKNLFSEQTRDFTDVGYQTQSIDVEESSSWDTMHLFASTPTKVKK